MDQNTEIKMVRCIEQIAKNASGYTGLIRAIRESTPVGCICPPGANLTCQSPLCPRKAAPEIGAK